MDLRRLKIEKKYIYIAIGAVILLFLLSSPRFRGLVSRRIEQVRTGRKIEEYKRENKKLREQIDMLENDRSYTEYLIRRDLGYIGKDEYEYRFINEGDKPEPLKKDN